MLKTQVNLLKHPQKPSSAFWKWGKRAVFCLIIFFILAILWHGKTLFSKDGLVSNVQKFHLLSEIGEIITQPDKPLLGQSFDRINILLLGIGGSDHEGTQLTDTIMIASLQPSTNALALISIPRDLLVPVPGYGWRKINSINAFAESKEPGSGGEVSANVISDLFNIPIHYFVRVDFQGFQKVIDDMGGIDVFVDQTLEDYQYPIRGKENDYPLESRFEHLKIEKGWHHFEGEEALKYVRSRHGLGEEGSDFARSKRQQNILTAVKRQVLSPGTILSPEKINALLTTYNAHILTDVTVSDAVKFLPLIQNMNDERIRRFVFDANTDGYLKNTVIFDGKGNQSAVLQPKSGDFTEIQEALQHVFEEPKSSTALSLALSEESPIEIQNGTTQEGLATKMAETLKKSGFTIPTIKNAQTQDTTQTIIYDLSKGTKPFTLKYLRDLLPNAHVVTAETVSDTVSLTASPFVIILGQDQLSL